MKINARTSPARSPKRRAQQPVRRVLSAILLPIAMVVASLVLSSCSITYDVGPGMARMRLADVPWQSLQPGDVVQIHYDPAGYHEKVAITESGTIGAPIRIVGVPGPNGELPVIDGANATAAYGADVFSGTPTLESLGVITIYRTKIRPYGYVPSNIEVSGIEVRGGTYDNTYTGADGVVRHYIDDGSAGIWAQGNNLVFRGNTIAFNGNGIFVGSKGTVGTSSNNVLFDGNTFHNNGDARPNRTFRDHAIYAEGVHVVYQANRFLPMLPGSFGEQIKDRSAGTVIRYNHFEGGKANVIQLECAADNQAVVTNNPAYRTSFIYGNTFLEGQGDSTVIVSAGDWPSVCPQGDVRRQTMYFYNNTVVFTKNKTGTDWATHLLFLNTDQETAEVFNNIILMRPATAGATPSTLYLSLHPGTVNVGKNWISSGWQPLGTSASWPAGTVNVVGPTLNNPANDPGFANIGAQDHHLVAGAQAVDAAVPLPAAAVPLNDVAAEHVANLGFAARPAIGAARDLGAFEFGATAGMPTGGGPVYPFPPLPIGATSGPPTTTTTTTASTVPANATTTAPPAVGGPELVGNGDFETTLSGWAATGGAPLTRVTGGSSGSWSARVAPSAGVVAELEDEPNWQPATTAGTACVASAWVKSTPGTVVAIRLREVSGATEVGTSMSTAVMPSSSWHYLVVSHPVLVAGSSIDLRIGGGSGVALQVDGVSEHCG